MTTDNREDYLINILRLTENKPVAKTTELASLMDVSAASVSEMLKTLKGEGMVNYEKYKGVSLTDKGREYAKQLRRKHHIMERFLINVLDTDEMAAHVEAHKMEHVISDESADKMCMMLGPSDECEECNTGSCDVKKKTATTLTALGPSSEAVISHIKGENPDQVRKLISMGFVPGKSVKTDGSKGNGPRIYRIGDCAIALDKELTDQIYINVSDA